MNNSPQNQLPLADAIELACLIEATARKPGNVHPAAGFTGLEYSDFVTAARLASPHLAQAREIGVGRAVLNAVQATASEIKTNANLGICLLLAPLAAVQPDQALSSGVKAVLQHLTVDDAKLVYEAIRLANPGGMGEVPEQDLRAEPTESLLQVMKLAADRDSIAAEYAQNFRLTIMAAQWWPRKFFHDLTQRDDISDCMPNWELLTIGIQLTFLMMQGDSLIRRKCGDLVSHEAACRAEFLLKSSKFPDLAAIEAFDIWLRADGHRRNPGTTADLVVAVWFAAIRESWVTPPSKNEVVAHAESILAGL